MTKIIGIMAIKNAVSQGYPFLEAIYSFLNWGDELYLADDSNDGTENIVYTLKQSNKIKLFKISWPSDKKFTGNGGVIAYVHSQLIKKIKLDYDDAMIFYLQANEIAHEQAYTELRDLYKQYPDYLGYLFPYQIFVGPYMIQDATWRIRYANMHNKIKIFGDGTHMEVTKELSTINFLKEYLYEFYRYLSLREYYFRNFRRFNRHYKLVYLSKPIFRYGIIFPDNIFLKMEGHAKVYNKIGLYKDLDTASSWPSYLYNLSKSKKYKNIDEFYKLASDRMCKNDKETNQRTGLASEPLLVIDHPKIMLGLLGKEKYEPREDIIKKIINC